MYSLWSIVILPLAIVPLFFLWRLSVRQLCKLWTDPVSPWLRAHLPRRIVGNGLVDAIWADRVLLRVATWAQVQAGLQGILLGAFVSASDDINASNH